MHETKNLENKFASHKHFRFRVSENLELNLWSESSKRKSEKRQEKENFDL